MTPLSLRSGLGAALLTTLCGLSPGAAWAHDSWFARLGSLGGGEPLLALGTGNQFPVFEFAIGPEFLVRQGCRWPDGQSRPMQPVRVASTALVLRPGMAGAASCWAQLQPFDVEVPPEKVEVYLKEVNASPALRATWAAMHARGATWKERYTKHARVELQQPQTSASVAVPGPDMALDIRRVSSPQPGTARAGDALVFEVRRGGQPLAGLQVELRHSPDPTGTWHETDAQGQVRVQPSSAGDWLLRGVDLRPSTTQADHWESDFLTLSFTVLAR